MQEKSSRPWLPAASHAAVLAIGLIIGMRFAPTGPGSASEPSAPARTPGPADDEISGRAPRPPGDSTPADTGPHPPTGTAKLRMHADGSIFVPRHLSYKIGLPLLDHEGKINVMGLAAFGLSDANARHLQNLVDEAKAAETEREARAARVLNEEEKRTIIWIPAGKKDTHREKAWHDALDTIFGGEGSLVARYFHNIELLTGQWGSQPKIVTASLEEDGTTSYTIHFYAPGDPPAPVEPGFELPSGVMRTEEWRGESIPDRLRHLFE